MSYQQAANFVNRPKPQLEKEHKVHLINFYNGNQQARLIDTIDSLT